MTNDESHYDIAKIRELLTEAFTLEALRRFCQDHAVFQPILRRFGPGHAFDDMIDRVIEYCRTQLLFGALLAEVKQVNPRQYARFEPDLLITEIEKRRDKKPPEPTPPDLLTINAPISLELVRVPAGEFRMGSDVADEYAYDEEWSPHRVYLPEFYIGRYPVTNIQYLHFVRVTGYQMPLHWEDGKFPRRIADHPVTCVSWENALAFCAWMGQETGKPFRLPTEAEWEKAARGEDGRLWPWGNEWDPERCNSNETRLETTTPVGQYSPAGDSPYGCADMAGNVWEWCQSLYKPYPYQADDGREDLRPEGSRVLRGGAFSASQRDVRCADRGRHDPSGRYNYIGVRVVVAPGPSEP